MLPFREKSVKLFTLFFEREIWLSAIDIELFEKLNLMYLARNLARQDLGRNFVNTN